MGNVLVVIIGKIVILHNMKKTVKPKTQSQRIRAILFLLWEAEGSKGDHEVYYNEKTEKYIKFLQKKLDDLINPPRY